jgi:hypothetical protein
MDERETLLREICGEDANAFVETRERAINTVPLFPLRQILPDVVERLKHLLMEDGKLELAASVEDLQVYDRCRCGTDYCATVYSQPRPAGGYGPTHRNLVFWNPDTQHTTIIDVVDNGIACIETLDDDDSRDRLTAALPEDTPTE